MRDMNMNKQIHLTPEAFQIDVQEICKQIEASITDKYSLSKHIQKSIDANSKIYRNPR